MCNVYTDHKICEINNHQKNIKNLFREDFKFNEPWNDYTLLFPYFLFFLVKLLNLINKKVYRFL